MKTVNAVQRTPRNIPGLANQNPSVSTKGKTSERTHTVQRKFIAEVVSSKVDGQFEFKISHKKVPGGRQFHVILMPKDESAIDFTKLGEIEKGITEETGATVTTQLKTDPDLLGDLPVDNITGDNEYPFRHTHPELVQTHDKLFRMGDDEFLATVSKARREQTSPEITETLICNLPLIQKGFGILMRKLDRLEFEAGEETEKDETVQAGVSKLKRATA